MTETMKNIPKLRFPEFRDAAEWEEKPLSKIGEIVTGNTPSTANADNYGGNKLFVSPADISDKRYVISTKTTLSEQGFKETRHIKANSILFVCIGSTIGKVAQNKFECATNQQINSIIPFAEYSNDFVYSALENSSSQIALLAGNHAVPIINKTLFSSVKILVPDFQEQQKIADCLSSVDELITSQAAKVEALKEHKKALMQRLFPRDGESIPRLRFPEFQNAPEWEDDILDNVARFRRGSFPQPYGLPEWYDEVSGTPFIQVFDVNDDLKLKPTTKSKISKLGAKQSVFIPQGTLIVTIQGSIGRVAITQYDAYIDRTLLLFEEFLKPIDKLFFAYVIQNLFAIEKEKAPGGIIKTITKEVLSDFKIKLPSFDEQQKIGFCLSSIDELITSEAAKVEALKEHKKALMQRLFPSSNEK